METKLSKSEEAEVALSSYWQRKFKDAMVAKAPYTKRWATYWDAYYGDYFKNKNLPDYKSNLVSNYIFSTIETIRPIMFDQNPKFQAIPRQPEGMEFSNDWQEVLLYEWDREDMTERTVKEAVTFLVVGTAVLFMPWDAKEKNVKPLYISPDNLYVDPLATSPDDAGYLMYAKYIHAEKLKTMFPGKAHRLTGSKINYSELVQNNNTNTQFDNQILVIEAWVRDYESKEMDKDGNEYLKYPNGRVITFCPEIGVVLGDKPNPYEDGKFPFRLFKDYDVPGKFWGEGEVAQLLSPQQFMNELGNAIIDNAKVTANSPWIVDKNAGIGEGKITSRPGLVIRKTPGTEVRREQPASMPQYVIDAVERLKMDIQEVSGIFDSVKGNSTTGVYTAQGTLALQEASQTRIRLKVKLLEASLSEVAKMWVSRIRQFWKEERYIAVTHFDGSYDVKSFNRQAFKYDYDVKITAGSTMTMNRSAMLDLMIRLAQTQMPDGQMLVDREAVVAYLPEEAKSAILKRMAGKQDNVEMQLQQIQQALEQNTQNDQQTVSTLQNVAKALEGLKQETLRLQQEYDKLKEEKAESDKINQIEKTAYNQGYKDAEEQFEPNKKDNEGAEKTPFGASNGVPDDILNSLSSMDDNELMNLLQSNPELQSLLNQEQPDNGFQGGQM